MEVKGTGQRALRWMITGLCGLALLLFTVNLSAQPVKSYIIKKGRMYIQLPKDLRPSTLDSFVSQYDLGDLDLHTFLRTNNTDSLLKLGWKIDVNHETAFIISKAFEPFNGLANRADKILFSGKGMPLFPVVNNGIVYGVNKFRNKASFSVKDSIVLFFLRGNTGASKVMLAGSFNNWVPNQLAMQRTDSGWIAEVKLRPGKYWYKFIADGNWMIDRDNSLSENDGTGNTNSVYFKANTVFTLRGFTTAKKVFVAGSFNEWQRDKLLMTKTTTGWELPLYLAEGTHTYKFVADGKWYADDMNKEKLPDGHGEFNSVLRIGKPYLFKLAGFNNARQVVLAGSFNRWKDDELFMTKTATGWELPYTLGPGNYEYKFKADGKWITDPANTLSAGANGNSYLIIEPNYTFRLKNFKEAKKVFLAGDFNGWNPTAYAMKKEGDDWVFPVHLSVGKHLYKYLVDDKWIVDPGNKLWEQNEYNTGNSIVWIEQ